MGLQCKDGVVLGVEKMLISKMLVPGTNRRVHTVEKHIGMVRKGSVIAEGTLAEVIALAGTRDLDDAFVALLGEDA